ncbi:hypothetical protein AVEN_77089-1 [Araneus ventricosus]|uniref:Uncharacterized protein n=1 Tax=Araneus ventricosus TaxID=182803 RepID=A0A4Y2LDG2_ARAVE|nr:hypothetical protein AVEN_77089-1 [Araneus ventricosus]
MAGFVFSLDLVSGVEPMERESCSCEEAMDWQPIDSIEEMEWEEVPLPPQVSVPLPLKTEKKNAPNKPSSVRKVKKACLRLLGQKYMIMTVF